MTLKSQGSIFRLGEDDVKMHGSIRTYGRASAVESSSSRNFSLDKLVNHL